MFAGLADTTRRTRAVVAKPYGGDRVASTVVPRERDPVVGELGRCEVAARPVDRRRRSDGHGVALGQGDPLTPASVRKRPMMVRKRYSCEPGSGSPRPMKSCHAAQPFAEALIGQLRLFGLLDVEDGGVAAA